MLVCAVCHNGRQFKFSSDCLFVHSLTTCNRHVRQERLGRYIFEAIQDVQDHATRWLCKYNEERSNIGVGGVFPIQKLKMKHEFYPINPLKMG